MVEFSSENLRGKWSQPGVPHTGWHCVGTKDLREQGVEYSVCQMCESQKIRFVHTMVHANYPGALDCGCDCAGHMEQDSKGAKLRDTQVRSRAARRQKFPDRKGWKTSAKGNPYIKLDGYHCVVTKKHAGFGVGITPPFAASPKWGSKTYRTVREAQEACFDAIEYEKNGKRRA
jgi:hypothetical protein